MNFLKNKFLWTAIILSFLGSLDAAYLTIIHYKNIIPPCSIAHGCETVLTSQYATIGPVPIALLGVFFYLSCLGLLGSIFYSSSERSESRSQNDTSSRQDGYRTVIRQARTIMNLLFLLTGLGALTAIGLILIQAFILHAYCQYCLASEAIDFLLFGFVWALW